MFFRGGAPCQPSSSGPWLGGGCCRPCARGGCTLETLLILTGPLPLPQTPHPIPLPDPRMVGVSLQDCCEYQGPSCGSQCPESSWGSSLGVLRVAPQGPHMGCAPVKPGCPGLSPCPRHTAGSALLELGPGEGSLAMAMLSARARRSTAPGGFAARCATSSSSTKGFWAQTASL